MSKLLDVVLDFLKEDDWKRKVENLSHI